MSRVVQDEMTASNVRILVEMIYSVGFDQGGAAFDAMHLVALFQQQFGEVGPVLAGYTGNQCALQSGFIQKSFETLRISLRCHLTDQGSWRGRRAVSEIFKGEIRRFLSSFPAKQSFATTGSWCQAGMRTFPSLKP